MYTDVLEFVEAKFNQNLTFVQLFISSYRLKIYIVYIISYNTKFTQYFEQTHGHVQTKR